MPTTLNYNNNHITTLSVSLSCTAGVFLVSIGVLDVD